MNDQIDLFSVQPHTESHTADSRNTPMTKVNTSPAEIVSQASTTLHSFAYKYAHRIWDKSAQHRKRSLAQLDKFVAHSNHATLDISDFKGTHFIDFLDEMKQHGSSEGTCNRYAATVSSVFKFAVKMDIIASKPHVAFFDEPEGRIVTYTEQQINDFIDYFRSRGDQWMADIIETGANTGMRKGEIEKVDNPHPINGATLDHNMKTYTIHKCKNGLPRSIPLNDRAYMALSRLQDGGWKEFTHRKFYARWSTLRRAFNLTEKDVFHVIRHTVASHMANKQNANIFLMRELLGHKDLKTTQKYVHANPEQLRDIVNELGA